MSVAELDNSCRRADADLRSFVSKVAEFICLMSYGVMFDGYNQAV